MILKDWIRLERRGPTLVLWATVILGREESKSLAQDLGKMGWEMIIRMKYKESHRDAGLGRGDGACRSWDILSQRTYSRSSRPALESIYYHSYSIHKKLKPRLVIEPKGEPRSAARLVSECLPPLPCPTLQQRAQDLGKPLKNFPCANVHLSGL